MEEHNTHFLFNLQLIFGGRMYTNFGIEILWVLFLLSGFVFFCSYDLGLCYCVPMIWVHLLVYFYSNLMYFYVLNFVFKFLNFVKINIKKKIRCWHGIYYYYYFATSAFSMPPMHSVCHLRFFCYYVKGRDQNKNDFFFLNRRLT